MFTVHKAYFTEHQLPSEGSSTVYAIISAGVLFSRISRVRHRENFHFSLCAVYRNGHITKIAKLSPSDMSEVPNHTPKSQKIMYAKYLAYTVDLYKIQELF